MTAPTKCPITAQELRRLAELIPLIGMLGTDQWIELTAIRGKMGDGPEIGVDLAHLAADLIDERDRLRRELEEAEAAISYLTYTY